MPCCTVHGRAPALKPVRVQVAAPILLNVSKPWYCAAGPIRLTSNDPMPEPPSCKRLLAPDAITSPLMIEVGPKVSVLPPLPAKEIAKVVPVIVPLLVTLPAVEVKMPVPRRRRCRCPRWCRYWSRSRCVVRVPAGAGARDGAVIGHGRGGGVDADAAAGAGARDGAVIGHGRGGDGEDAEAAAAGAVPVPEMVPLLVTVAVSARSCAAGYWSRSRCWL